MQIKTTETASELRVSGPYNPEVIESFRSRGGKWDGSTKEWVFKNGSVKNGKIAIKELFGESEEVVTVRVGKADDGRQYMTASEAQAAGFETRNSGYFGVREPKAGWKGYQYVCFGGYLLAARRGRDYGADIVETLVQGTIPKSGGSVKNPAVECSDDCVFELEVRRDFAEFHGLIESVPKKSREEVLLDALRKIAELSTEDAVKKVCFSVME